MKFGNILKYIFMNYLLIIIEWISQNIPFIIEPNVRSWQTEQFFVFYFLYEWTKAELMKKIVFV